MQSAVNRRSYAAVSSHAGNGLISTAHNYQTNLPEQIPGSHAHPQRNRKQYNYKPVPLRLHFLAIVFLVFSLCIVLIEILLHNSHTTTASNTKRSTVPEAALTSPQLRWSHHLSRTRKGFTTSTRNLKRADGDCDRYDLLPGILSSLSGVRASLCADFATTFQPYTGNLSFPLKTAANQWLIEFNSVTSASKAEYLSSIGCEFDRGELRYETTRGTYTKQVPLGCSTTFVEFAEDYCSAYGTILIEGQVLTSSVNEAVCGWSQAALEITSQPRESDGVASDESLTFASHVITFIDLEEPTATITLPDEPTKSQPPVVPAATLPTITLPAETAHIETIGQTASPASAQNTNQPAQITASPQVQKTAVGSDTVVYVAVADTANPLNTLVTSVEATFYTYVDANGIPQTSISAAGIVAGSLTQIATTNAAGQVETVVALIATAPEASRTIITVNAAGEVATVVAVGVPVIESTYIVTNAQGQVATHVTAVGLATDVAITYLSTDSQGYVQTMVTFAGAMVHLTTDAQGQVSTVAAAPGLLTYVTTNAQGQVQTVVTSAAVMNGGLVTYTTTDAQGQVQTVVTSAAVMNGSLVTYTTTDAQGQMQTVVTSHELGNNALTTYTTTNALGEVLTVVSSISPSTVSQSRWTTTTQYTSLVTTTGKDGKPTAFLAVVVETVTLSTSPASSIASKTTTVAAQSTVTRPPQPDFILSASQKVVDGTFTKARYVIVMFFPTLVAIVVKVLWEMVLAAVKLVQPFERMVNDFGAEAPYSIFAQYLSSSISLDMFEALGHGNLVPLWTTILYYLVQIGAPISAASMTVKVRDICIINNEEIPCDPAWVIDTWMLRGVEAALVLCLVLTVIIAWSTHKSRTGIRSDPSSLTALAKLSNHQPLLTAMHEAGTESDRQMFERAFDRYRFRLGHHRSSSGEQYYGIIGIKDKSFENLSDELEHTTTAYDTSRIQSAHNYHNIQNSDRTVPDSSHSKATILSRLRKALVLDTLGLLLTLTLFVLVLAFYLDHNQEDVLNKFFNSKTIVPRILLISLAAGSAMHLAHLERCIRVAEPFRRLAAGTPNARSSPSPPQTTLLIDRSGTSYSNLLYILTLLQHEHHGGRMSFQLLITFTTIIADLNVISASGVAYSEEGTRDNNLFSTFTTLVISGWTVLVYIVVIAWWRRNPVIKLLGGEGISKGVGTIGGTVRWLCSGGAEVVEAVALPTGEFLEKRTWKDRVRPGRPDEGEGLCRRNVWFMRYRIDAQDGREKWAFVTGVRDSPRNMPGRHDVGQQSQRDTYF